LRLQKALNWNEKINYKKKTQTCAGFNCAQKTFKLEKQMCIGYSETPNVYWEQKTQKYANKSNPIEV